MRAAVRSGSRHRKGKTFNCTRIASSTQAGTTHFFERPLDDLLADGIPANEWALIELDLAELGLEHRLFDGIRLTGLLSGAQAPIFLDDIVVTSRQAAQAAVQA
jgi:hypothetical protein